MTSDMICLLFVFILLEGDLRVLASADKPTTFLRLFQARVTRILRLLGLGLDTLALGFLGRTLVILFVQLTAPTIRALLLRELVEYAIADLVNHNSMFRRSREVLLWRIFSVRMLLQVTTIL